LIDKIGFVQPRPDREVAEAIEKVPALGLFSEFRGFPHQFFPSALPDRIHIQGQY
jgi:hypothetical protein